MMDRPIHTGDARDDGQDDSHWRCEG
jgi:hypothetical protein